MILRGFLVDGKPDAAVEDVPGRAEDLSAGKAGNPPTMEFISGSKRRSTPSTPTTSSSTTSSTTVIQQEPLDFIDPELRGLAASIGIVKGKPFAPDERMKKILTEAVAVGNATARAITFRNRDPRAPIYQNSHWKTGFIGGDYRWLDDDGVAAATSTPAPTSSTSRP